MRLIFTLLLAIPAFAFAQDAELYDPAPPLDSAFVRLLNPHHSTDARLEKTRFGQEAITPYHIFRAGEAVLKVGGTTQVFTFMPARYYSLALSGENVMLFEDAPLKNPAKARIYLYNFSGQAVTLHAPEHKANIFTDLIPSAGDSREVNALTLPLAIMAENRVLKHFNAVELKRRQGISIFVTEQDAFLAPNTTSRTETP